MIVFSSARRRWWITGFLKILKIVTMLAIPVVSSPADTIVKISSRRPCLKGTW